MTVMGPDQRLRASDAGERALDAADRQAQTMPLRFSNGEAFGSAREMLGNGVADRTAWRSRPILSWEYLQWLCRLQRGGVLGHLSNPTRKGPS